MESPVRIYLGAAVVVNILLLTSTTVNGSALPHETNRTTITDENTTKYNRMNSTWSVNNKTPDVALNELHPKESASEEHTEKNAKYKDRGRVKFHSQLRSSTESTLRRIRSSTEPASLVIVTPKPDSKNSSQIDSMRTYKTKAPDLASSTSTSATMLFKAEKENQRSKDNDKEREEEEEEEEEEDDEDEKKIEKDEKEDEENDEKDEKEDDDKDEKEEEEEEEKENIDSFKKYTSSKFYGSNLFNIHDNDYKNNKHNQVKDDTSTPSFEKYSSYFSKDNYRSKESKNDDPYKSQSFFDFDSDLTTPKNNFFDQKYHEISTGIMKNLASMKGQSHLNDSSPQNIIKKNVGIEKFSNGSPNNKSMVIIKNTKEIRVLDNDQAGSANRELSDVHGTSIYYEMSVLSTETYNINHSSDDDCENETLPLETMARGTSQQVQDASFKATQPTIAQVPTKPVFSDLLPGSFSTLQPLLSVTPNSYNTITPMLKSGIPISTQTSIRFTDRPIKVNSSSFTRNRSYSKRLNLTGTKESPNSVTQQTDQTLNLGQRPLTRKFYYTTPKVKPIWMSPRRNVTKAYKTTYPTTIYAEHFNIKDKFSTTSRPSSHQKTILTTVPSDIDPVLQSDVGGVKKVVHSQIISDNTIPSLWKRGSMKITTAMPSTEFETSVSDLEIPPTMTAWALASLRSPPPLSSSVVNVSGSSQKSVDENELQKVGEVLDKRETTTASTKTTTTSSTVSALSNDIISKNITDIDQNKLPWKPVASNVEVNYETVTKSERLPAESNILIQGNLKPSETIHLSQNITEASTGIVKDHQTTPSWILAMYDKDITTTEEMRQTEEETIQPVDTTKSTGFESITKLPSGVTTPTDENNEIVTEQPKAETTTDYEITTIRFSYVPTEDITETQTPISNEDWHPVIPTRTIATTFENNPITTYRPTFLTTTEEIKETTSVPIDTTPQLEISSQTLENATQQLSQTIEQSTTEQITTPQTTTLIPKIKHTTSVPIDTTPQLEISSQTLEIATQQQSQTIEQSTTEEITTPRTTTLIPTIESTTDYQETTLVDTTPATLIETEATTEEIKQNSEYHETVTPFAEKQTDSSSEENSDSNEVISQDTISKTSTYDTPTTTITTTMKTESTTVPITTTTQTTLPEIKEHEEIIVTTDRKVETTVYTTTEITTKSVNELEDLTSYADDVTTETSSQVLTDEAGSGAAIAIAVSTIGVIALVLLVGLLLVVRRRGRRGVYAQRCTPVSLDAYSLDSVSVGHRKGNHRLRASKRSYGNPAYDDEVTSHPMQYPALANFALDVESISAEFAEIPSVSVRPEEVPAGCEDKNRYSNVLPLPETRVPLRRIGNDPTTEYINANYVTGPGSIRNYYILCQAPMSNTVVDFWRMIWEQNSRVIVMLTEYMENGVEKCYEYLPPSEVSDNKRTFGDYQIILKKREQRDKYAISTVQLINTSTRSWRELTHLWYFWPAKGVPDDYDSVIDFLSEMRSYMKISQTAKEYDEEGVEVIYGDQSRSSYNNLSKLRSDDNPSGNGVNVYSPARAEELLRRANNGTLGRMKAASDIEGVRPCVCVCATGAGRSAALVALDACARALAAGAADVPRAVRELRAQRPHALANRHHYIFLYKVLSEYGNKLMGVGVDTI